MFGISGGELFLIILVALIFFGSKNIPDIFKGLGKAYYEFKNATNSIKTEITQSANSIKSEVLDQANPITKELHEARKALAAKELELKEYMENQTSQIEEGINSTPTLLDPNSTTEEIASNNIPEYINSENGTIARTSNRKKTVHESQVTSAQPVNIQEETTILPDESASSNIK